MTLRYIQCEMVSYKRHPHFIDYSIGTDGKVISHKWGKEKELKQHPDRKGYLQVKVLKEGKEYSKKVHRLVAETYIENPNNLPQVNHINQIKDDNRAENLEWCDNQYNQEYSKSKYYLLENLKTGDIRYIFNLRKTCKEMGLTCSCLHRTLTGERNHHKGYKLYVKT